MKQVIIIRKDLNMRKGKMIAQGAHASIGAGLPMCLTTWARRQDAQWFNQWIMQGSTKIVVGVDSEDELLAINDKARMANLPYYLVKDEARTEFKEPTYTAVAIGPAPDEEIDKITGHLKLL